MSGIHTISLAELAVTNLEAAIAGPQQLSAEIGGGGQSGTISLAVSGNALGSAIACGSIFSAAGTISGVATFSVRVFLSVAASQCTVDSINCEQGVHLDVQVDHVSLLNSELTNLQVAFTGTDSLAYVLGATSDAIVTLVRLLTPTLFQDLSNLFTDMLVPEAQRKIDGALDECYYLDILNYGQAACDQCTLPEWLCRIQALSPCF